MSENTGTHILNNALLGAGATTGAAGLYYLLHGLRNVDTSNIIPTGISGYKPGANVKRKKKKPSRDKSSPLNNYKYASGGLIGAAKDLYNSAGEQISKFVPKSYLPGIGGKTEGAAEAWKRILGYGAAGVGGYGALSAITTLRDKARRLDNKEDVEAARQEYLAALSGKSAAALDELFDTYEKQSSGGLTGALDKLFGNYVYTPALGITLGTGLVGGKYMYDKVKDQTRQKNLARAAAARARLAAIQDTPYVNPEELAFLTKKKK